MIPSYDEQIFYITETRKFKMSTCVILSEMTVLQQIENGLNYNLFESDYIRDLYPI